jgi:hypothetical protein
MTEKTAAVYQRGRWLVSNISDVRIIWNITVQSKSKGKGKASVVEEVRKELRREELERLLAKKAAIQEMIDNLLK